MELDQHFSASLDCKTSFYYDPVKFTEQADCNFALGYIIRLLQDKETPIREISNIAIKKYIKFLHCRGTIFELGAPSDYYKQYVPIDQDYVITDNCASASFRVDMTNMPFQDNSVDAFFSAFALEHVKDYHKAILEIKRTLKPGGRLLLVVPFLYYYHAAPSDYVRFTSSYLEELFSDMLIHRLIPLGNRSLCIAEYLHEKCFTPVCSNKFKFILYRTIAALLVLKNIVFPKSQPGFAAANLILVEKVRCD